MKNETRITIETWLKKQGFTKKYGHDCYLKGQVPNQRVVDLETEPPFVGISSGIDRQEAEVCSIGECIDIKNNVLRIYNENENPVSSAYPGKKEESTPAPKVEKSSLKIIDLPKGEDFGSQIKVPESKPENKEVDVMPKEKKESNHLICAICEKAVDENRILDCVMAGEQVTCKDCKDIESPIPKEELKPENNKGINRRQIMPEPNSPAIRTSGYVNVQPKEQLSVEIIKKYICAKATDSEAYYFLQLCINRGLNPFLNEAYLVKYSDAKATMIVGKDAFTRKAEESGQLDGLEAGIIYVKDGDLLERVGTILLEGETLVGGWARVTRKDMKIPFEVKVSLQEFDKNQSVWKTQKATMIRKVAVVNVLREAFTKELGGCYGAAEISSEDI